jgi:formylglycine-generating enzyme required for sulfatase activity
MDRTLVTRGDFLSFVKKHPEWARSRVKPLFADSHYLSDWRSDFDPGAQANPSSPVVWVSWFAAKAYCESKGLELPSTDQWEYAAYDQGRNQKQITSKVLEWYATPATKKPLPAVGCAKANGFGIYDLFGLVWEWTLDFNGSIIGAGDKAAFCGAGSIGVTDPGNYAASMRESFRSSLKASYTTGTLGFRCVRNRGSP